MTGFLDADRSPPRRKSRGRLSLENAPTPRSKVFCWPHDIELQPLVDIKQPLFAAEPVPLADQAKQW